MLRMVVMLTCLSVAACAGTSYGIVTDGTFPNRPSSATYPNWDHLCTLYDSANATEALNDAGSKGWELVALGTQSSNNLMCFKRLRKSK